MKKNILLWKYENPPIYINTFEVKNTASYLRDNGYFEFYKNNVLLLNNKPTHLFNRSLCLYSSDIDLLKYYIYLLNDFEKLQMLTYPRGCLDSPSVVCGIAPGYTRDPYYECFWLLGPSSKLIYEDLKFSDNIYYTNICKEPFVNNMHSDEIINKWSKLFIKELNLLKPKNIIFLGKYKVYSKFYSYLEKNNIDYIQLYHPSYYLRKHIGKPENYYSFTDAEIKNITIPNEYFEIYKNIFIHKKSL